MNKKILFVLHRIGIGGSMTSMLNLLELLKANGVECDLFLMDHSGNFLERAKNAANLLPENKRLASVICNKDKLTENKDIIGLMYRISYIIKNKLTRGRHNYDSVYKKEAKKIKGYDTVVAFQEGLPTNFVQYIDCDNKVAWVHNEFKYISSDKARTEAIYKKYNKMVCVSKRAQQSIIENIDVGDIPVELVYNTISDGYIKQRADIFDLEVDRSVMNIISLGRMANQKRFDRIIPVAKRLKAEGKRFYWRILGGGELFDSVYREAEKEELLDVLEFLGPQSNPYPYIKASDCLVLTSLYEAHPMVAIEGLVLGKPVITTNYPSACEVVTDGQNGLICSNDEEGIYVAVNKMISDEKLFSDLSSKAVEYKYDNEKILKQVKEILQV